MESEAKRQRKANWGEDESLQLAIMYRDEVHVLRSNFKHVGVSNKKKHNIWETITAELNTQFHHGRTALEVKKRWFTISSKARTKLQKFREHRNGTGGGPPPQPLDPMDEIVEDILGKDNSTIMGMEGINGIGEQKATAMEDQNPSIALSITQEGAEETKVLVEDIQQVPEHPLATLQPPETAAKEDAAAGQERVAAAKEEATAARAKAAAAEEEIAAARATARAARAREEAARSMKAAAEELAACVRALAGAAWAKEASERAGEAAERARVVAERAREVAEKAREAAAKEKAEAMRLQQVLYKINIEKAQNKK